LSTLKSETDGLMAPQIWC